MKTIFPNPEPELAVIIVETTTACNIRCIHCAVSNEGYAAKTLRYESFENIVPIMKRYRPLVKLNGHGETLAHKRFFDMLHVAVHAGCRVVFQTNATLLVPTVSRRLLAYAGADKLVSISISIDGVGDIFNEVRRKADWQNYVSNIKTLRDLRAASKSAYPYLDFQFTAMLLNIHTLPATVAMVKELGGHALTVGDLLEYPTAAGQSITRDLAYSRPFYEEAKRVAKDLAVEFISFPSLVEAMESIPYAAEAPLPAQKSEYATPVIFWKKNLPDGSARRVEESGGLPQAKDSPQNFATDANPTSGDPGAVEETESPISTSVREASSRLGMVRVKDCTDPWKFAFIQADGKVRPCCWIADSMGDINSQSFETIWDSKKYNDLRAAVAGPNPPPECWRCQARGWKWIPEASDPSVAQLRESAASPAIKIVSSGLYEGHLDLMQNGRIFGWAWQRDLPDEPISVDLYVDEIRLSTAVAGRYRPDLESAGKGNGRHAFELGLPHQCLDGKPHSIRLCYEGTDTDLFGSPTTFCAERKTALV